MSTENAAQIPVAESGSTPSGSQIDSHAQGTRPKVVFGAGALTLGGVLLSIGAVIKWFSADGENFGGLSDGNEDGRILLLLGIVLIGFGVTQLIARRVLAVAILAVVFSVVAIYAAIIDLNHLVDIRDSFRALELPFSTGPGLVVALIGSFVALGGGVATLVGKRAPDGLRTAATTLASSLRATLSSRLLLIAFTLFTLLSITRMWTDQNPLTSSNTTGTALRLTVPILLAALAALWAERSGVLNIGIEGLMIFGTWFGAWGAWKYGPWVGLLLGVLGGMFGAGIHALATVKFNVDQVISGVVLNILALFGCRYLSEWIYAPLKTVPGAGITQSPPGKWPIPRFNVPFLAGGDLFGWKTPDLFGWLEKRRWLWVGDFGGIGKGLTSNLAWSTVIAVALVPLSAWVLWRTRFGLRLRSSGEQPTAAESLGVNVIRVRYQGLLISGGLAGLGGATLSIVASTYYRQGQTGGRGFIGIAAMIFGNWRPTGVLAGAGLFGYADSLKLTARDSVTALFLFITFVAGVIVIMSLVRKKVVTTITGVAVGALFYVAYLTVKNVPETLVQAVPYLVTLIVLATASGRLRPPAMAGAPYRPGESH